MSHQTLYDIVSVNDITVFKGIVRGGRIAPSGRVAITPKSPCLVDFSSMYLTNKTSQPTEFVILIRDYDRGPRAYFFQHNYVNRFNVPFVEDGVAHFVSENQLVINLGDPNLSFLTSSSFKHKCGDYREIITYYQSRSAGNNPGETLEPYAFFGSDMELSSMAERDAAFPCTSKKSH